MPYTLHDHLNTPSDSTILWRYLKDWKFEDLVSNKQLFFASGKLLQVEDSCEGSPTLDEIEKLNQKVGGLTPEQRRGLPDVDDEIIDAMSQTVRAGREARDAMLSESCFFNCWHINERENDAMWKKYVLPDNGCAVVTTIGRLKTAIANDPSQVFLDEIRYVDLAQPQPRDDLFIGPYLRKLEKHVDDHELRALVFGPGRLDKDDGIRVAVDPSALINRVVISPHADELFPVACRSVDEGSRVRLSYRVMMIGALPERKSGYADTYKVGDLKSSWLSRTSTRTD